MYFEISVTILFILKLHIVNCQDFGYYGSIGPKFWSKTYHNCTGKHQSPIDIEVIKVVPKSFPTLEFEYFNVNLGLSKLENNGHSVVLSLIDSVVPTISGGPLKNKYKFAQLHFHWGKNDLEGSENKINHHSYPLELHMVFFKQEYDNYSSAINYSDGISVLSFLYKISPQNNIHYEKFEEQFIKVLNPKSKTELHSFISMDNFTTTKRVQYFTYNGSLTTPPCSEVVTWIEFTHTIPLSHNQVQIFRQLYGPQGKLGYNFRPIQPISDRIIYYNSVSISSKPNILNICLVSLLYLHGYMFVI